MKKKNLLLFLIMIVFTMCTNVDAAQIPQAKSGIDYSTCKAFSDTFKSISRVEKEYYYKYCFRATCNGNGTYILANMEGTSGYRCLNGNGTPYIKVESDACQNLSGSCSVQPAIYCEKVVHIDCTKLKDGKPYDDPYYHTTEKSTPQNPLTNRTTSEATTEAPTQKPTQAPTQAPTQKPTQAPTQAPTTTTTTTTTTSKTTTSKTTTTKAKSNNTGVKTVTVDGKEIKIKAEKDIYDVKIPYGKLNVSVKATLSDKKATYKVEGNKEMPDENTIIYVIVTAEDGTERIISLNVNRYVELSNNCKLKSLKVKNYSIKFNSKTYDYKLKVPKTEKSLEVEAVAKDKDKAKVKITGTDKIKHNSLVKVTVTAEDGTKCVYTIKVKNESSAVKILIVLILVTLVALIATIITKKSIFRAKGNYKYE